MDRDKLSGNTVWSRREMVSDMINGSHSSDNYPGKPEHKKLSLENSKVVEQLGKAKELGFVRNEEDVARMVEGEEKGVEQRRRQELLFSESTGRLMSYVVQVLEDDKIHKNVETSYGLKKGEVRDRIDSFGVLERLKMGQEVCEKIGNNPERLSYELGVFVSSFASGDRVSRSNKQWGLSDTLFSNALVSSGFNVAEMFEQSFVNYRRESQGPWGTLLSLKFRDEIRRELFDKEGYGFDDDNGYKLRTKLDVMAGSSGMAILKTLVEMVPEGAPVFYSNTSYFEIMPEDASKIMSIEEIKKKVIEENHEDDTPVTVMLQPYSSSPGSESNSLDDFLDFLKSVDGGLKRPVDLIVDATMIPTPVTAFKKMVEEDGLKKVRLTTVNSLIKHGQMGLDMVPGAIAVSYGEDVGELRYSLIKNNGFIPEEYAARLLPYSVSTMKERMKRAGDNAKVFKEYLNDGYKSEYGLFEEASISENCEGEYGVGPGLVFLALNKAVNGIPFPMHIIEKSENLSEGTSYGFDKTRIEHIPDINGRGYLRIAPGQEGDLSLMDSVKEISDCLKNSEIVILSQFDSLLNEEMEIISLDDEEMVDAGYSEEDKNRSRLLLLSLLDNSDTLSDKARDYLLKDYRTGLRDSEKYREGLSREDKIGLLVYSLDTGIMVLGTKEDSDPRAVEEIEKLFPGLKELSKNIPVNSEGVVDGSKIVEFVDLLKKKGGHEYESLVDLYKNFPVSSFSLRFTGLPSKVMDIIENPGSYLAR